MDASKEFCKQVPAIYESFIKVIGGHAVGDQILGPTKNPCPTFFTSAAMGNVWNPANWGSYPQNNDVVRIPIQPVKRLIAIGDFHGDLTKARQALEIAKLLGKDDKWIGGKSVLVQVGDIFDRGNSEIRLWYLLEKLRRDAYRHGGAVHVLHGNHETLNLQGRHKNTIKNAYMEFANWNKWYRIQNHMREMVDGCSPPVDYKVGLPKLWTLDGLKGVNLRSRIGTGLTGRFMAVRPGGPIATEFVARCPTVLVVGKSMFVHGGIRYSQTRGGYLVLNGYNVQVNEWVKGKADANPPAIINSHIFKDKAVTWNRDLAIEDSTNKNIPCSDLHKMLSKLGLKRLLVGHTIQKKRLINSACNEEVIRLDVGMSGGCVNNPPQVLEILDDEHCFVLGTKGRIPLSESDKLPPRPKHGPDEEDIAYRKGKKEEIRAKKKVKDENKTRDGLQKDSSEKLEKDLRHVEKTLKHLVKDISHHTDNDTLIHKADERDWMKLREKVKNCMKDVFGHQKNDDSKADGSSKSHKKQSQEGKQKGPVKEAGQSSPAPSKPESPSKKRKLSKSQKDPE